MACQKFRRPVSILLFIYALASAFGVAIELQGDAVRTDSLVQAHKIYSVLPDLPPCRILVKTSSDEGSGYATTDFTKFSTAWGRQFLHKGIANYPTVDNKKTYRGQIPLYLLHKIFTI